MEVVDSDVSSFGEAGPPIWKTFQQTISKEEGKEIKLTRLERHAFYERAKKAFAIVATSETAVYANLILKKGVVRS